MTERDDDDIPIEEIIKAAEEEAKNERGPIARTAEGPRRPVESRDEAE